MGLNLTHANYAIILEPSMDAHDEAQSICRVHRIGQTRPVTVLKLYNKDSIEERILKRRQMRGELSVSINATGGGGGDGDEEDGSEGQASSSSASKSNSTKKGKAASSTDEDPAASVSSSRTIKYEDLKLLLGV